MELIFKRIAQIEGVSALLLFFYAMPLKYLFYIPIFVKYFGMIHGVLFTIYIAFATFLKIKNNWSWGKYFIICLLSIPPFGTFYMEHKYLKNA